MSNKQFGSQEKCLTGIPGLDEVLRGGLPRDQLFLLQGEPGTGKTSLALQFLLEGARTGEKTLYITFSETKRELEAVAESHGWDLSKISILELSTISEMTSGNRTTLFHPSEIELSKTVELLFNKIKELNPTRIALDSLSELRMLSETSLRYRRQMLMIKEFFVGRGATVLFLDDLTSNDGDDGQVQSVVHGVLLLEKFRAAYGVERRQFHIVKLRGVNFKGGTHDYVIEKGGLKIFPRLVAADHESSFERKTFSSGVQALDQVLGGGLDSGTGNLIIGPAGSGKSTICIRFAISACERGEKVALYTFEESLSNLVVRAKALDLDIEKHVKSSKLILRKVDPAELTPGQFASILRDSATEQNVEMVIIDSLNGYIHAMPEQQFLMLQLHELLSFLGSRGVVTIMVLAQAGLMGAMQTPLDLTYLADSVIITRYFEAFGSVKKAISVIKKRTGAHEESLRELRIGKGGVIVGNVLNQFSGIFTGVPRFTGSEYEMLANPDKPSGV